MREFGSEGESIEDAEKSAKRVGGNIDALADVEEMIEAYPVLRQKKTDLTNEQLVQIKTTVMMEGVDPEAVASAQNRLPEIAKELKAVEDELARIEPLIRPRLMALGADEPLEGHIKTTPDFSRMPPKPVEKDEEKAA